MENAHRDGERALAPISLIEYSTRGGPELGSGLAETEWHLRVDLAASRVELERHSPFYLESPDAIGVFRAPLERAVADGIVKSAEKIRFEGLPQTTGGGPGVSELTVRVSRGSQTSEVRFPSRDTETYTVVEPLLDSLSPLLGSIANHPVQALRVELAGPPAADKRFHFRVRNVGTSPLAVVDPRGASSDLPVGVRVAPHVIVPSGTTEPLPNWTLVPVHALKGVSPKTVTLAPGATLELETVPWRKQEEGPHLAQAVFASYLASPTPVELPIVRGRAYSPEVALP